MKKIIIICFFTLLLVSCSAGINDSNSGAVSNNDSTPLTKEEWDQGISTYAGIENVTTTLVETDSNDEYTFVETSIIKKENGKMHVVSNTTKNQEEVDNDEYFLNVIDLNTIYRYTHTDSVLGTGWIKAITNDYYIDYNDNILSSYEAYFNYSSYTYNKAKNSYSANISGNEISISFTNKLISKFEFKNTDFSIVMSFTDYNTTSVNLPSDSEIIEVQAISKDFAAMLNNNCIFPDKKINVSDLKLFFGEPKRYKPFDVEALSIITPILEELNGIIGKITDIYVFEDASNYLILVNYNREVDSENSIPWITAYCVSK